MLIMLYVYVAHRMRPQTIERHTWVLSFPHTKIFSFTFSIRFS